MTGRALGLVDAIPSPHGTLAAPVSKMTFTAVASPGAPCLPRCVRQRMDRAFANTIMPMAAVPWWPPSGYDGLAEDQVRQLFAYLRTATRPVISEGERRIREITGPDLPIRTLYPTVKNLTDRRLGTFDVLKITHMEAGTPLDRKARFAIGFHRDGALMVTPNLIPATHLVWE